MSYDISTQDLLDTISTEDVIKLMEDLDCGHYIKDDDTVRFKTICHGGNKHKLYYYTESKTFFCYSECGSLSLFNFLMQMYNWEFIEAFNFLIKFKGLSTSKSLKKHKGFKRYGTFKCSDWEFLNRYTKEKKTENQENN